LHFDGHGKGIYQPPAVHVTAGRNLNDVANTLIKDVVEDQASKETPNGTAVHVEAAKLW